ncbi:hypothetical protein [Actinoplanes sp. DH11]|uniref:hypothetical protein n=1 Tax=Actinoplanes sp. DH11 TaxID=2857011 RepID=UPI001E5A50D7|nr:hypothetical protein [Actinoplanes sp. DH11]
MTQADVIAIDHHYDWSILPHPDQCLFWPQDGLAIAAVVAGHLRRVDHHAAIVLRTGALDDLAGMLPREVRQPVVAAQNSIDWVFMKGDPSVADRLHSVARAVSGLQALVADPMHWNEGSKWLKLPDTKWGEAALADVQVCHPPENTVAAYTAGTAWLRWFAHRILPFPSFLLADEWAANLLRLTVADFRSIVVSESPLSAMIRECLYEGELSELVASRWWRAGLDSIVDLLLLDAPADLPEAEALAEQMTIVHGGRVTTLAHNNPVVVIDSDYAPVDVTDASECVRLAPDFWPSFAQEPWTSFEEMQDDPSLRKMVARGDRLRSDRGGIR